MALKLGLNLGYWGIGPKGPEAAEIVRHAEGVGYESVWVAESYGSDAVSVLAWPSNPPRRPSSNVTRRKWLP